MDASPETATNALLLTVPEVCTLLALGRSTIYTLMAAGELEIVHIGRSVRITAESTVAFVERRKARSARINGR